LPDGGRMKLENFELERLQSLYEHEVDCNLTESGLYPYTLRELLDGAEIEELLDMRLGYGQTNGTIGLRQAISRLYPGTTIDRVLVTNGTAEANLVAIWSLLEPGDELVFMLPNYLQIWGLARSFGTEVKPFFLKEELAWAPDLDELRRQVTPKTKMIAVCNPNNPTGAVLTSGAMDEIVRLAGEVGAWLYADEVYRGAELSGEETPSFFGRYEKTLVTGGLSKAYGLPGLRLGWLVGQVAAVEKAWSFRDYTSISSGIIGQKIATWVLQPARRRMVLDRGRQILEENVRLLGDWVDAHRGIFSLVPPRASGIAYVRCHLAMSTREFSTRLRQEKSVFVQDGECFGLPGYIRVSIGVQKDVLLKGLRLIDEALPGLC